MVINQMIERPGLSPKITKLRIALIKTEPYLRESNISKWLEKFTYQ